MHKVTGKRISLALLLMTGASACHPVEQASLVYSSSHQIGASVVSGTPETPGLVITVGYRGLNAAYVPVAVAKHCPAGAEARCNDVAYRLTQVLGHNNRGHQSTSDREEIARLTRAIADAEGNLAQLNRSIEADQRLKERVEAKDGRVTALTTERLALANNPSRTIEQDQRIAQIDAEIRELNALEALAPVQARIGSATQERDRVTANLREDRTRRDNLERVRQAASRDDIEDALSVYGTFNGQTTTTANTAGLTAGQVFSTGVAAQHLTRAQGASVHIACLHTVRDIAAQMEGADKTRFLLAGAEVCRRGGAADEP